MLDDGANLLVVDEQLGLALEGRELGLGGGLR